MWQCNRYLPIEEYHTSFVACLELRRATDKMSELWSVDYRFMEEDYVQLVKCCDSLLIAGSGRTCNKDTGVEGDTLGE